MDQPVSVAFETTCRAGGVALGGGDGLVEVLPFDATRRAAGQLVTHLDALTRRHGLTPADLAELYVSVGPGSFTGTRVGVTVARTLAQALPALKLLAVPTVQAVARNALNQPGVENLAVVLDARRGRIYWALFARRAGQMALVRPGQLATPDDLLAQAPRPLHLIGEGLGYHSFHAPDVTALPEDLWLPRVEAVWTLGRQHARTGPFTDPAHLLPIYATRPAAEE